MKNLFFKRKLLALSDKVEDLINPKKNKYQRERERAEYLMLSTPTSGRTWVRIMIGHILKQLSGIEDVNPMDVFYLSRLDSSLPCLKPVHEFSIVQKNQSFHASKKIILMTRDPRDTLISVWRKRQKTRNYEANPELTFSIFIREFAYLDKMLELYEFYNQSRHIPKDFLHIRYEDFLQDTYYNLKKVTDYLELEITEDILNNAINFASFKNMKKMDAIGESVKVRQGRSGFYKETLSTEDLAYIEKRMASELSSFYGYELTQLN